MRRSSCPCQGLRMPTMSEAMKETMEKEMAEAIAMMNRANRAIDRLFNAEEREEEDDGNN
jgi:hypothetical protein